MNKFFAYISGQIQPQIQPANEPYYNTVPEYKQHPETGHTTGNVID